MSANSKRGRPFVGKSELRYDLKVRVDDDTHKSLIKYSEKMGITIAEAIRQALGVFLEKK